LNSNNCKEEAKKNNMLCMDLDNQVDNILDVNKKIVCTMVKREVNMNNYAKEKNEMTKEAF
jgi:hypothetical protein